MTDQELKDLVASLALDTQAMKAEADKRAAEADKRAAESERLFRESKAETDRQLRELGKQIGGLGNKFGSFTEGLAMPSVQKLLFERFGIDVFMSWVLKRSGGKTIELDALGIANGLRNEAYIVEIKSHLRNEAIEQLLEMMGKFRQIFPEYAQMKLYGLIATAHSSEDALQAAQKAGFYVLTFEHDLMRFHDENGFMPKAY